MKKRIRVAEVRMVSVVDRFIYRGREWVGDTEAVRAYLPGACNMTDTCPSQAYLPED